MIKIPEKFYRAAVKQKLSPRQIEVCYCIGIGWSWKQIADELNVSLSTVKFHAANVAKKIGVWNCVAAFARILHLAPLP